MEETKITVNGKEVESIGMQETPMFADREDIMEAFNYAKELWNVAQVQRWLYMEPQQFKLYGTL